MPSNKPLASEVLIKKVESTLPSQLGGGLVVPWRGVVMETMIDPFINVHGVGHMICLECFLVRGPPPVIRVSNAA
jgi:hypothetical protein